MCSIQSYVQTNIHRFATDSKTLNSLVTESKGKNRVGLYNTPLPVGVSLVKNEGEPYELDLYRSAIGSLIYLSQWTRVDIAYAVSALAAHMSNPSRDHHVALKHVLHYLH